LWFNSGEDCVDVRVPHANPRGTAERRRAN
jgi:hypothetical protein